MLKPYFTAYANDAVNGFHGIEPVLPYIGLESWL